MIFDILKIIIIYSPAFRDLKLTNRGMKILTLILLISCLELQASDKSPIALEYMSEYKAVAISEMHRSGIPASIKLAQGMLESNWGRSDLANKANNHFGIKCGSHWTGREYYREDDDRNAQGEIIPSCFRRFTNVIESYIAHSDFLTDNRKAYRYGFLFELDPTDYKGWAYGLKQAGYATDPKYPEKLITIIEQYNLDQYDISNTFDKSTTNNVNTPKENISHKLNNEARNVIVHTQSQRTSREERRYISKLEYDILLTNDVRMVVALGGETIHQLSKKIGVSVDEILSYNEKYIQKEEVLTKGEKIYIERKKRKLKEGPTHHLVKEGETMATISQIYGLRLKSLYAKNRMPDNSSIIVGEKLSLKETVSLIDRPQYIIIKTHTKEELLFEDDPTVK